MIPENDVKRNKEVKPSWNRPLANETLDILHVISEERALKSTLNVTYAKMLGRNDSRAWILWLALIITAVTLMCIHLNVHYGREMC